MVKQQIPSWHKGLFRRINCYTYYIYLLYLISFHDGAIPCYVRGGDMTGNACPGRTWDNGALLEKGETVV